MRALFTALLLVNVVAARGWRGGPAAVRPMRFSWRSRAVGATSSLDLDEVWWEDGLTCVEYEAADGNLQLGVYVSYSMVNDQPHIRPICAASDEDGCSALLQDEDVPAVPLESVRTVLDPDYVCAPVRLDPTTSGSHPVLPVPVPALHPC
jgi:hypothetical protein